MSREFKQKTMPLFFLKGAVTQCSFDCVYYPGFGVWNIIQTTVVQMYQEGIVARHPGAQGSGCLVQNLTPSITGTVTLEKGDNNRTYLTGLF